MKNYLCSPIKWFGGKGNMVSRILPLIPEGGNPYCEPYCGGASIFFARQKARLEVLNDLDVEVVNFFRCLQDKTTFEELKQRLLWTSYSLDEFRKALEILENPKQDIVTRAWAFYVRQTQGMSGMPNISSGSWSRAFLSNGGVAGPVNGMLMRLSLLESFHKRLQGVVLENQDALSIIQSWDNEEAVFYLDPPYHLETRTGEVYKVEMDSSHHERLVEILITLKGKVVLSGYNHPVYFPLEDTGWMRVDFSTGCYAAVRSRNSGLQGSGNALMKSPRVESVWINPAAQKAINYEILRKYQR